MNLFGNRSSMWRHPSRASWWLFPPVFAASCGIGWYVYLSLAVCPKYLAAHPEVGSCAYQGGYASGIVILSSGVSILVALVSCLFVSRSVRHVVVAALLSGGATVSLQVLAQRWHMNTSLLVALASAAFISSIAALATTGAFAAFARSRVNS